jgi:multiple sugar transport system substrate-binding protein
VGEIDLKKLQILNDIAATTASRRRLLQGAGLAGAAALLGKLAMDPASVSAADKLKFYHDKVAWNDFFKAQGDLAEKAIGVNWDPTPYSDTTSYQAAVLAAVTTSETPDFFTWWSGYRIEDLYKQGVLTDVSDIWAQAISAGNLSESVASAFTFDGKQWAVPASLSYWVVWYNKKVYADNGLSVPATWADFTANCDKLKAAGVTPLASTQDGRWPSFIMFEELVLRTDPNFYVELTAGRAKYTDPTCVKAMATWKTLIDAGYFTAFDSSMTNDWPGMFSSGKVAMIPVGSWYQSSFTTAGMTPGTDYDLFIMPNVDPAVTEKVCIVETGALAIANKGSHVDDAKKMAAWWITPDAQAAWSKDIGDTPVNPKATIDNPVLQGLLSTVNKGYTFYQRYWEASPVPIVEGAVDFLAQFMLNPGDAQSVLENIQKLADTEWAKRGGPAPVASPVSAATPAS